MRSLIRQRVLSLLWRAVKRRYRTEQPYVIAVKGSVGKTSTKEAVATMLAGSGRPVVKTFGNLATDSGIPLSLLGFEEKVADRATWLKVMARAMTVVFSKPAARPYWVLEYSSDAPGDLAYLGKRIQPDVVMVTSGGPVHMEYYKTQAAVLAELQDLLKYQRKEGYVVIHGDDPYLQTVTWPEGTLTYGVAGLCEKDKSVDVRATVTSQSHKGMVCSVALKGKTEPLTFEVPVIGKQQLAPVIAAVVIGQREGLSPANIKKGAETYRVPAGRGRLVPGVKGITIVDDSANASPEAAIAGVGMLRSFAHAKRTVAILGTMNEMGDQAVSAHREVAAAAAKAVDFFVAVGQFAQEMVDAAKEAGMASHKMLAFATPEQLFSQLEQVVERNDIIYVKASQNGMRLERLVKRLMESPADAEALLVRQTTAWK
jgi:UDP-N-acetylmuramyl pentapeptide synthase